MNPQLREMMQNPEFVRQLTNPEMIQVQLLRRSTLDPCDYFINRHSLYGDDGS